MGLDAVVYCRCFEDGKLRVSPPMDCRVDGSGALEATTSNVDELIRFDRWRANACDHEGGIAIHRRLGNAAMIAVVREILEKAPGRFSILLSKVVYSGVHAGDHVDASLLTRLAVEVDGIGSAGADITAAFQRHMRELIAVARAFGKPIAF